ncbi:hypothetical protein FOLKNPGA_01995 [Legionella sp. PC1000]|nr:hypothetical protein FOLKNPGA_01995 [Legionella sp. PC1000]
MLSTDFVDKDYHYIIKVKIIISLYIRAILIFDVKIKVMIGFIGKSYPQELELGDITELVVYNNKEKLKKQS